MPFSCFFDKISILAIIYTPLAQIGLTYLIPINSTVLHGYGLSDEAIGLNGFGVFVVGQRIQHIDALAFFPAHGLQLLGLAPALEHAFAARVLIVELADALVIGLRHHVIQITRQSRPLVGELHVTEPALVAQRLEVLLRRPAHARDRGHPLPRRPYVFVVPTGRT